MYGGYDPYNPAMQDFSQAANYQQQAQQSHVLRDAALGGGGGFVFAEAEKMYDRSQGINPNNVHLGRDMALGAAGGGVFGEGQKLYNEHEARAYDQMGNQVLMQQPYQQQGFPGQYPGGQFPGQFQQGGGYY